MSLAAGGCELEVKLEVEFEVGWARWGRWRWGRWRAGGCASWATNTLSSRLLRSTRAGRSRSRSGSGSIASLDLAGDNRGAGARLGNDWPGHVERRGPQASIRPSLRRVSRGLGVSPVAAPSFDFSPWETGGFRSCCLALAGFCETWARRFWGGGGDWKAPGRWNRGAAAAGRIRRPARWVIQPLQSRPAH